MAEKLFNLEAGDNKTGISVDAELQSHGFIERDFGIKEWDWPQGVGIFGLNKLQKYFQDFRYDDFLEGWFSENFKIGLPARNINTTAPFLTLIDLAGRKNNPIYAKACEDHALWIMNTLPRTKENGFQHVVTSAGNRNSVILNEGQLWIDTLFMAVLFLNEYGQQCGKENYTEEAVHQILLHIKYLYEKEKGLFYHGWSFERNDNFGKVFWCRGNSWFTLGITEFLSGDRNFPLSAGVREFLVDTLRAQVHALSKFQTKSGLWRTVLDDDSSYEEVSGSAGIAAGILNGIKLGILGKEYQEVANRAVLAICQNISDDGTVLNVSAGTAIGMNREFYTQILIRPMAYGQALALIALGTALSQ